MQSAPSPQDLCVESLSAAYRSGALTPTALLEAIYRRIETDALSGEWIHLVPLAQALQSARNLEARSDARDLPLFGVPFGVKDNIDVAGLPTTAACPAYAYTPESHAPAVAALIGAGALCLGKLNLDQFATGLVGSRSPYGAALNVFDPAYVAGGSSSGSALAVAAHHVAFALGTDTAGSGRVPAALNNLVGLKPSVGRISTEGVVPACKSLDCLSIFALNVPDATLVRGIVQREHRGAPPPPQDFRFGVPAARDLVCDAPGRQAFERAREQLIALGGTVVEFDYAPFSALGDLLYGPFVWERYLAVGSFIESQPDSVLPVTREIILGAKQHSAEMLMAAVQKARALRDQCLLTLEGVDVLLLPSVPAPVQVSADAEDPLGANDSLGFYTRFVNFVGSPVMTVPQDLRADGLPSSVSLVGHPGRDEQLDAWAEALHRGSNAGMGHCRHPLPASNEVGPFGHNADERIARLAVVGAHMRDMALNGQLLELGARYVTTGRTSASYRLFALPGEGPERPGLVRTRNTGTAIEVELWDLTWHALGRLLAKVPAPLCIGSLELEDGTLVRGFLCEASACEDANDISRFGGYRAYCAARDAG